MDKLKMHSPDLTQNNIAKLRELFPGCVTEARGEDGQLRLAVDFDLLRQELSDELVEGPQERYHLDWPGKREALFIASAPIAKTLRPCLDESENFFTAKNLFIEGDNLEALKLLQETYLGKVKMIYIDPPYNTGSEFIYDDNFIENNRQYLAKSNQTDNSGSRLVANTETNGRFHSDWLTMIYPRLKLARNLLSYDGVIFISIDDGEVASLQKICSEIFGEENFVGNIIWQSRTSISNDQEISLNHNHTLVYARDREQLVFFGEPLDPNDYENPDNDTRGPWKLVPIDANKPGGDTQYPIRNPKTGEEFWPPNGRSWAMNPREYERLFLDGRIKFGKTDDSAPKKKLFYHERIKKGDTKTPSSILLDAGTTKDGTTEMMELFDGKKIFDYPKPTSFMERLLNFGCYKDRNSIVLDFFAGSCSLAHACLKTNNVSFITVQIAEPVDESKPSGKNAIKFGLNVIADIGKERLRRALRKLQTVNDESTPERSGFRVLKVDTSNMADVYYTPDQTDQRDLLGQVANIKPDRTPEDLLFQVLVDWGVDLTLPIREETVQGRRVFFVNEPPYDLLACFDDNVTEELVKQLATHQPLRAVFRDTGYATDATRTNVVQIFRQLSPGTEVKSL
ncbi:site-specific DNA-methyltransferase [Thiorhodovibrio frisius]|uniref:site-specific DNA-methyltransferase (adenine-specific) n=1 Tax=Thiorhodovibrio frisius TaxID=631362 RepID=H8Z1B8_9GAMM|nr:site-specific DNA-methyltransferase [Thiorhodovibrio frisius]EIC21433.1 adenine specific DNA methylase Mod [Thiorhodovibrio frisius]WPL24019.1 putative methyltransferase [Thiorhodovibrio frisius]